jgi:hypothetical protein
MSEFIKIGDVGNLFNTIKPLEGIQSIPSIENPTTVKKGNNGSIFFATLVIVGVTAYLIYKNTQKKKKEVQLNSY